MKKIKKLRKKRIISLFLLVCLITITLTFAIYRESISKLLNLNIIHPSYTVTFDANGGSVSTASKSVTYKHQYGELPTPTRDEYQFKGWNGKNLFETGTLDDYYIYYQQGMNVFIDSDIISSTILEGQIAFIRNEKHTYQSGNYIFKYQSSNGRKRHLIFPYDETGNILTNSNISIHGWTYNKYYGAWYNNSLAEEYSIAAIPNQVSYWKYGIVFSGANSEIGKNLQVSDIMIEQGSTATPYEPYYITSSTEVVQAQDHTLTAIWEENPYTVTFDANGGTVSKASKKVKDGEEYGTLPIPTRDGYTFKGWNGKNMLDLSNVVKIWNGILNNDGSITANLNNKYYVEIDCSLNLNDYILNNLGKSLTFSMNESIDNRHMGLVIYGTRTGGKTYQETSRLSSKSATITIADDFTSVSRLELRFNREINPFTDTTTTRSNFMLEQGSTATPYEPYYITSSTEVVQAQNHTLKAIWEPNTYTVSFNKNDNSASGSMSNISMTYDVSSTLPSNSFTKTGYKFVGWNTKADGSGTTYSDGASVSNLTTTNNATVTLYAQWKRVMANNVEYDEPEVNCNNVQCMIDELYDMLY